MDSTIFAAIIGATATIVSSIIAAILGKKRVFDNMFIRQGIRQLVGKWSSEWIDFGDESQTIHFENFYITKQKGSKIRGYITMDSEAWKRWEF